MEAPPGWTLRHTLRAHKGQISRLAWSRDGRLLATPGTDGLLIVWDTGSGKPTRVLRHGGPFSCAAFSPDGKRIACGLADPLAEGLPEFYVDEPEADNPLPPEVDELLGAYETSSEWDIDPDAPAGALLPVGIMDVETGETVASFYSDRIRTRVAAIAWSSDGRKIVTASEDGAAIWQTRTGQLLSLDGERSRAVALSADGKEMASTSGLSWSRMQTEDGKTIEIGDLDEEEWFDDGARFTDIAVSGKLTAVGLSDGLICVKSPGTPERYLEGQTQAITSVSFSADGGLLASKSLDGTVWLWDCERWQALSVLREPARGQREDAGIAFAPGGHALATLGPAGKVARVWDLDLAAIAARREVAPTVHYANAKVVLLGDSGVGKTGLGLVLASQGFRPTESSHQRNVWLLDVEERQDGEPERRETYLWDLAGQPGYRLLHQLHLRDAAVAVVVFDAKSESDPFAGVRHWVRALRQSEADSKETIARILVAARMDRGGPQLSDERRDAAMEEFGFSSYLKTSAKTGAAVDELHEEITRLIDWDALPKVSSTGLFESIKSFLIAERDQDKLLLSSAELRSSYIKTQDREGDPDELAEEFDTCIGRVAARGVIRRLSFGGLVLLRPEVLDAYAASLTMAAREQPDGMGSISEDAARRGEFPIPAESRVSDDGLERLLLTATVEEVLRHEVALREHSDEGPYLVFPTQSRREAPSLEDPYRPWLEIEFEGPVQNVYATLVVRLAHSGLFERDQTYLNAATFTAERTSFGVSVVEVEEGIGILHIFGSGDPEEPVSGWFADYVIAHAKRRAVASSVKVHDEISCAGCGLAISGEIVDAARARGRKKITCPVCDASIDLARRLGAKQDEGVIRQMDKRADEERTRAAATAALHGKEKVGQFDVFLAHHSADKPSVRIVAEKLRNYGLNPWVDEEQIPPGRWFQDYIEQAIGLVGSAAIILGKEGLGRWEKAELKAFVAECVEHELPVIPVLLPGASLPEGLKFLKQLSWVHFEESLEEKVPMERLRWGITAGRPPGAPGNREG
jgi:small GTP-binding protein